ncbi:hypothetical protein DQ04_13921010 [Trypanosoma grayi]|uniref:hypothetical protein n=1 Tax=Trypanosoma grayi TaxID=71804 RepID=UPI0004F48D85|nr:hypothetical protein DQ04_13921010 [Trypanosoma grayi]KEG06441.1 hypothetical protein DQ04_13921010 [Trypanosoma grayi]
MMTMRSVLLVCALCAWCACGCAAVDEGTTDDHGTHAEEDVSEPKVLDRDGLDGVCQPGQVKSSKGVCSAPLLTTKGADLEDCDGARESGKCTIASSTPLCTHKVVVTCENIDKSNPEALCTKEGKTCMISAAVGQKTATVGNLQTSDPNTNCLAAAGGGGVSGACGQKLDTGLTAVGGAGQDGQSPTGGTSHGALSETGTLDTSPLREDTKNGDLLEHQRGRINPPVEKQLIRRTQDTAAAGQQGPHSPSDDHQDRGTSEGREVTTASPNATTSSPSSHLPTADHTDEKGDDTVLNNIGKSGSDGATVTVKKNNAPSDAAGAGAKDEEGAGTQGSSESASVSAGASEATGSKPTPNAPADENVKDTKNADSSVSPVWVHAPLLLLTLCAVTAV